MDEGGEEDGGNDTEAPAEQYQFLAVGEERRAGDKEALGAATEEQAAAMGAPPPADRDGAYPIQPVRAAVHLLRCQSVCQQAITPVPPDYKGPCFAARMIDCLRLPSRTPSYLLS